MKVGVQVRHAAECEKFLIGIYRRGVAGEGLDMICVDYGSGLLAAMPNVFHRTRLQRCPAHKIENVLNKVHKVDQPDIKRAVNRIMNDANARAARSTAHRFAERCDERYPAAVACLRDDLDGLLTRFPYETDAERRAVRTTNAVEWRFREVRRRIRPTGTFQGKTSMNSISFAVFTHENKSQGLGTLFLLTQNN